MDTLYFPMGLCLHDRGLQRHGSHYTAPVRVAREPGFGPYFVTLGSVSKLSRLAPMPLPAGTKLGTHENSRLHLPHSSRFAWHFPELAMTLDLHHPHVAYMTIN